MADVSRQAVLEALWDWDPIGIGAFRGEAASEYDDLATRVAVIIDRDSSEVAVDTYVRQYLGSLGVRPIGIEGFLRWVAGVCRE